MGRDRQHGVQALDRREADQAGQRALAVLQEDRFQVGDQGLDVGHLERKEREGHAPHPVDVEDLDHLHQVARLTASPGVDQQVAGFVRAQGPGAGEGLQDLQHRRRRGIVQRYDGNAEAAQELTVAGRHERGGEFPGRHFLRHDHVSAVDQGHGHAVEGENVLQRRNHRLPGERLAGPHRDGALHRGIDDVAEVQCLAQNDVEHIADFRVGEVEGDLAVVPEHDVDAAQPWIPGQDPAAAIDLRARQACFPRCVLRFVGPRGAQPAEPFADIGLARRPVVDLPGTLHGLLGLGLRLPAGFACDQDQAEDADQAPPRKVT